MRFTILFLSVLAVNAHAQRPAAPPNEPSEFVTIYDDRGEPLGSVLIHARSVDDKRVHQFHTQRDANGVRQVVMYPPEPDDLSVVDQHWSFCIIMHTRTSAETIGCTKSKQQIYGGIHHAAGALSQRPKKLKMVGINGVIWRYPVQRRAENALPHRDEDGHAPEPPEFGVPLERLDDNRGSIGGKEQ